MSIEVLLGKNSNIQVVLKTDDSRTAIEYLRTYPVDLVILDIELPGTDGFTLLKRIKFYPGTYPDTFFYRQNQRLFMPEEQ
ncbi:transcriptional regulator [Salmonella enterica subsp. enterica]|uniref:Transcriptional regulator n=1 Tax=Salmonella enterica I TaxID=59201 RepID=A0A447PJ85_SALET|nr:transcriptional regulator [Salmonella enterica subsp. enterica]